MAIQAPKLIRQHSRQQPGRCFCLGEVGAPTSAGSPRALRPCDLRLGCGCVCHFSCLESYALSQLDDWGAVNCMASSGVGMKCPCDNPHLGPDRCGQAGKYFITAQDLDSLINYGELHATDMTPRTPARRLTKDKVNLLRTGYLNTPVNIKHEAVSLSEAVVDALSQRCPNTQCPFPFNLLPEVMPDAWENCCAAKCPSCGICFCWFCFLVADPPDYATRHNHVSRCRYNPNENGDPFLRPASRIEPVHRQRRIEAVRRTLARHSYSSGAGSRAGSGSGSGSATAAGKVTDHTWLEAPAARAAVEAAAPRLARRASRRGGFEDPCAPQSVASRLDSHAPDADTAF